MSVCCGLGRAQEVGRPPLQQLNTESVIVRHGQGALRACQTCRYWLCGCWMRPLLVRAVGEVQVEVRGGWGIGCRGEWVWQHAGGRSMWRGVYALVLTYVRAWCWLRRVLQWARHQPHLSPSACWGFSPNTLQGSCRLQGQGRGGRCGTAHQRCVTGMWFVWCHGGTHWVLPHWGPTAGSWCWQGCAASASSR